MSDYWAKRIDAEWDYVEIRGGEQYRVVATLPIPEGILAEGEPTTFMSTMCIVRTEELAVHIVDAHNEWRNALADNIDVGEWLDKAE